MFRSLSKFAGKPELGELFSASSTRCPITWKRGDAAPGQCCAHSVVQAHKCSQNKGRSKWSPHSASNKQLQTNIGKSVSTGVSCLPPRGIAAQTFRTWFRNIRNLNSTVSGSPRFALTHEFARTAAKVPCVNCCKVFSVSDNCRRTFRCGSSAACSPASCAGSWRSGLFKGLPHGAVGPGAS